MKKRKEIIPLFKVFMSPDAKVEVGKVLDSGYIGQGPKVDEFESKLKDYFNYDFITTVNAGTSALHLALHMLKKPQSFSEYISIPGGAIVGTNTDFPGIEEGDEVLGTAMTCTASNWPILANGLKIKWVDIDPTTLNMDLDDLARKITPKTKAIIGVHWGGYPLDLDRIKKIQEQAYRDFGFKPVLIEDCAHAFGSKLHNKVIGSHGNLSMFSLQAIKHLTAVDGGLLMLPNQDLYQRSKLLRWYGIDRESNRKDFRCETDIVEWGFKFHMNDVNATIGMENMKHVDGLIKRHQENAKYYDANLKDTNGVTLLERRKGFESSFWIYSMLVEDRAGFYKWMKECNIMVSQLHERNDRHTCTKEFRTQLPALDRTIGKVVSIPVGWWVSDEEREYIVECIKKGW
jgi:dTDP-4-amino-4,6-dideoxygalactose transaminase